MTQTPRFLIACMAALSGCVPDFDDDTSLVDEARILAVRAVPAEVEPGGEVTLTAVVGARGDTAPDASYSFCVTRKPLSELGPVDPACIAGDPASLVALGAGPAVTATVPEDACRLFGPSQPPPAEGESAGRPADPDPTGGYYQPLLAFVPGQPGALGAVRLDCGLARVGRETLVEYNQRFRPNENPEIAALSVRERGQWRSISAENDPETPALTVRRNSEVRLRAEWASCSPSSDESEGCTGAETYLFYDPERRELEDRREALVVSWFATSGEFDQPRTEPAGGDPEATTSENVWVAPRRAGVVRIWVILRDGRGGVGASSHLLTVE